MEGLCPFRGSFIEPRKLYRSRHPVEGLPEIEEGHQERFFALSVHPLPGRKPFASSASA